MERETKRIVPVYFFPPLQLRILLAFIILLITNWRNKSLDIYTHTHTRTEQGLESIPRYGTPPLPPPPRQDTHARTHTGAQKIAVTERHINFPSVPICLCERLCARVCVCVCECGWQRIAVEARMVVHRMLRARIA